MGSKGFIGKGINGEGRILSNLDLTDIRFVDFGKNLFFCRVGYAHDDCRIAVALYGHGTYWLGITDDDAGHGGRNRRFSQVRLSSR